MGKVTFSSLKLKTKEEVKTFDFNGNTIEVKQYLPIEDKVDLIQITLQKAREKKLYNQLRLEQYFNLNLVYLYTNLSFTSKQREDESKIYDALESNGFFDILFSNFDENEYNFLKENIEKTIEDELKYNTTFSALVSTLVDDLPAQAEAMKDIMDNFDPEKLQEVVNFAKAANGGRPIN